MVDAQGPEFSGESGKTLHSETRSVIYSVLKFFERLSEPSFRGDINFRQVQVLTAEACGVSRSSVQRIVKEAKEMLLPGEESEDDLSFSTPGKQRNREPKIIIDDFSKISIRRIIYSYYDRNEFPTLEKLNKTIFEQLNIKMSRPTLGSVLRNLGFRYKKLTDGRSFLMERSDIVALRLEFLRKMIKILSIDDNSPQYRPVFYLDETWLNKNHTKKHMWQDTKKNGGIKVPIGKGERLIVCHVGSAKTGFVKECKWVFRSKCKSKQDDYHEAMNSDTYKEWFISFVNLLEQGSIIVFDNASYHSIVLNKVPTMSWTKKKIEDWLREKNIPFTDETKSELILKVAPYKENRKIYELDKIAEEKGHTVIRLPPYHCKYNPIELIWAQVKGKVGERNKSFKLADVQKLLHEELDNITAEDWRKCVKHTENIIKSDFEKELGRETTIEPIVINLQDSDSSSDDYHQDDDSDSEVLAEKL